MLFAGVATTALHPARLAGDGQVAQSAVVHIHAAVEIHFLYLEFVAAEDVVVYHGAQEVVCRSYGVQVAREVKVDIGHRHDLGIAAARGAPLYAEHGPQRRFAQGEAHPLAELCDAVGKADRHGSLALAAGSGVYGSD